MNPVAANVPMKNSHPILSLVKKDLLLEFRQQYTLYGILLYVASTIFVVYLSMGEPEDKVWNGLFWVIQLFVCVNAVAKSFLQESRGRMLYYIQSQVRVILYYPNCSSTCCSCWS